MTWLVPKLSKRVQILIPSQRPNESGGFDFTFGSPASDAFDFNEFDNLAPVLTIWMGMNPVSFKGSGAKYIRGEQVNEAITHEFVCRSLSVASLGKEYGLGFSDAFKFMASLNSLKSDYFLFVQKSSKVKGRLFKIHDVKDPKEMDEFLSISAEEIEERGTGFGA